MGSMHRRTTLAALTTVALLAAGMTACSDAGPKADPVARSLAAGLAAGRVGKVDVTGVTRAAAQRQLADATAGMGGLHPTVQVRRVQPGKDDAHATAVLEQRWKVPGTQAVWRYSTRAAFVLEQDRWRVRWTPALVAPDLAAGERLVLTRIAPRRGDILGDGGTPLVTARPVVRLGIDKTKIPADQAEASARALANVVGADSAAYAQRVAKAGPKAFVEAIVLRATDAPAPSTYAGIAGAVGIDGELPLAPTRDFARPVLGTVGAATAELVKDSGGRLQPGDVTGLSGLQKRYDEQLRGQSGVAVRAVAAPAQEGGGAAERELWRTEPTDGKPLAITLDERLQRLAETTLADVRPASAIVAVRPSDGHVLAAASGPGSNGLSTATVGRFAPGSTFKVVTSLGLLRAGLSAGTTVSCPATITVDGRQFKNYDDYPSNRLGPVTLRTAVANSCNTAMIGQRAKVPQPDLAAAAAALGLGVDHDLGYPVFLGAVPTDAGATEHAASMIGQGKVEASPVAMAAVAASVAKGATVTPQLLQTPPESPGQPTGAVTKQEADAVRSLMRAVVTEGSGRFLATLPGPPVAAKTGTAEFGTDSPPRTHAWMIAVQGDLAVAVFVDLGTSGSGTAGPLLERFLRGS
jgi:hypothetical protein